MTDGDNRDDAARAFADMAAELAVLRRTVEGFEVKLESTKARNYDATLGAIRKVQETIAERLTEMAAAPALKYPPEAWTQRALAAGEGGRQQVLRELELAKREVEGASAHMQRLITQAATAEQQLRWQVIWGGGGLVLGLFIFLVSVSLLASFPGGWALPERFSAFVMHEDRWSAGEEIARSANPERWGFLAAAATFEQANRSTLQACYKAATKTEKPQRCAVSISPGPALNP